MCIGPGRYSVRQRDNFAAAIHYFSCKNSFPFSGNQPLHADTVNCLLRPRSKLPGMALMCGDIEVITYPTTVIDVESHYVDDLQSTILRKASMEIEGHLPLPCDILFEYDLPIKLRDGVTVYADVYRPPQGKEGTVPAIIVAGPFGKNGGPNRYHFNKFPWRMGCPRAATSGLEKFEGPDPAYWCWNGYAIVHTGMELLVWRWLSLV